MLINRFAGVNLLGDAQATKGDLVVADNVRLSASGGLLRRPALMLQANVANTKGLYAKANQPAVIAADDADLSALPPIVLADRVFGVPTAFYDAVQTAAGSTAALIQMGVDEPAQVHICSGTVPVASTAVVLTDAFTPAPVGLAKSGSRICLVDFDGKLLRYSPVDDPTQPERLLDWTTGLTDDDGPGFVSLSAVGAGQGQPVKVLGFQDQVVVLWQDAYQQWVIAPDQLSHALVRSMVGAGCAAADSVAPAGDDLLLLGAGGAVTGFRAQQVTLAAAESTLGAAVEPATRALLEAGVEHPVGAFWPRLGLYILAFGDEAWVFALIPGSRAIGWTHWALPVSVDAMVAAGGDLWIRSGDNLYSLDEAAGDDEGVAIDVRVETAPLWANSNARVNWYGAVVSGDTQAQVVREGRPGRSAAGGIDAALGFAALLPGRAPQWSYAGGAYAGDTFALRLQANAAAAGYALSAIDLELRGGRGKGVR